MRDLDEFFDDTLRLPIGGVTYVVPGPDAETGLWCQRLADAGRATAAGDTDTMAELDDAAELALYERVLGPAYVQMIADGLSWPRVRHAGLTAFFWIVAGMEAAGRYWESGGDPGKLAAEPVASNRAGRRQASRGSQATAASTRSRGSTTSTTSARTAATTTRTRSRGGTSSTGGRS